MSHMVGVDELLSEAQQSFKDKNYAHAIIQYLNVIRLNPKQEIAYYQLGLCYAQLNEKEEVLEYLNAIIHSKDLSYETVYSYLGLYYLAIGEESLAKKTFERLSVIAPSNCLAQIGRIHLDLLELNWESVEVDTRFLEHLIQVAWKDNYHTLINPYYTLPLNLSKDTQLNLMRDLSRLVKNQAKPYQLSAHLIVKKRVHIGYLSSDLYQHPLGMLIRDMFQYHDREAFHIHVYQLNSQTDEVTDCIRQSVESFTDVSGLLNYEVARKIKQDSIDILVDLSAFTGIAKPSILAMQPAPIQCHMLGYPASLGSDYIQYFISSKTLVPQNMRDYFDEKIVYVPHPYVTPPFTEVSQSIDRKEYGLPSDAFVLACFTRFYKLDKTMFDSWVSSLKNMPDSVLWFKSHHPKLKEKMIDYANHRGVRNHQLIFFDGEDLTARWPQQLADVWLDTHNMSCGLGSILALWSGTPVVNIYGQTPQARVGASILEACPIAGTPLNDMNTYQEQLRYWYQQSDEHQQLKKSISQNKHDMPLFQPDKFIKSIEVAYEKMMMAYEENTLEDIDVT